MNKKFLKIVTIFLLILAVIFISSSVFASSGSGLVNSFNGDTTGAKATGGNRS